MTKQSLRAEHKKLRKQIANKSSLSKLIAARAIELIKDNSWSLISCYVSIEDEVETKDIIDYCLTNQLNIYIPHLLANSGMQMHKLNVYEDLEMNKKGHYQIKENILALNKSELLNPKDLEVIFTPLLAFDEQKHRLGYGKGCYDKFFASCSKEVKKVGLAFSGQKSNQLLPTECHDIGLNQIITETVTL